MSLITEELSSGPLSGQLFPSCSPEPHSNPLRDYDGPDITTSTSPSGLKLPGAQKAPAVTGSLCAVCGETAAKETAFRKHYGVICCEACKCFFRRTVQMSRDYKCRYDGSCTIGRNPVNMKQVCQACRFSQCLRAGMKIESVKKFPRKGRGDNGERNKEQSKYQKVLKNFSKDKRKEKAGGEEGVSTINGSHSSPPKPKQEKGESDLELEPELEHLKYSPEFHSMLDTAVPQLFNYDSVESVHERSPQQPAGGPNGLAEGVARPHPSQPRARQVQHEGSVGGKRLPPRDSLNHHSKKLRLESAISHIRPPTPPAPPLPRASPFSPPSIPQSAPYTPPPLPHSAAPYTPHPYSQPASLVNSPDSHPPSAYNSHANTPYATPHGTPLQSPLASPTAPPSLIHAGPHSSYPSSSSSFLPSTTTLSTLTPIPLPSFAQSNNLLIPSANPVFLNSSPQMPFRVLPMAQPLLPFVASFPSFSQQVKQQREREGMPGRSPFSIVPIPSSSRALPEEQPELPHPSLPLQDGGDCEESLASAPPSARASPEPAFKTPRSIAADTFPEAEVDEVLDSLRQRIRAMFSWAKFDVAGFEDLSPLDQKALLRRTVAELVMLGFARASIAYSNVLLLGKTGKAIRPTNSNSGVSAVASVTLKKLVEPLKVINMDDHELDLMKEIVLFNPESSCLRNREIVRQHRKRSHISLKEYTDKQGDPGRFGELMCLLTPLFEVSTEVTEQLRLEHFVHEGEARIDALLLMSMINGADEVGAA